MTLQVTSDFLAELLRLEREQKKILDLATLWDIDLWGEERGPLEFKNLSPVNTKIKTKTKLP